MDKPERTRELVHRNWVDLFGDDVDLFSGDVEWHCGHREPINCDRELDARLATCTGRIATGTAMIATLSVRVATGIRIWRPSLRPHRLARGFGESDGVSMDLDGAHEECDGDIIDPAAKLGSLAARGSTLEAPASTVTVAMSRVTATIGTLSGRGRSRAVRVGSLAAAIATLSRRISARRGISRPGSGFPGLKVAYLSPSGSAVGLAPTLSSRTRGFSVRGLAAAVVLATSVSVAAHRAPAQTIYSGNPILPGWYADPEAHVFAREYWIYPTTSARYNQQTYLDAFSSKDLITWVRHPHVLDTANITWAHRAIWAPSIVAKDGWYYLFFGANDIQSDSQLGGIGVARSRSPAGPFTDYLGKPLIGAFHNGAQPIDQMVFKDVDGSYYIVYGGWGHCNIAKLNADFTGFVPLPDGTMFKEITPKGYVEGAFMLIKDGKYYFMWSEGGWTGPDYAVAYAVGTSPFGPFERVGKILQQDSTVATGAGHHSVLHADGSPNWYIVYHRRPLGETDPNHRAVSIDLMHFDADGKILPVVITKRGVAADSVRG
jgi:hypothetical protein